MSPYYAPTAGMPQPAVHRTPWMLIVSAILVLVLVMAGFGTALAILGARSNQGSGGSGGIVPSPTPAASETPIATPTGSQFPTTASNATVTIPVPPGWAVTNPDSETISLINPDGSGIFAVASGPSIPAETAQQRKEGDDQHLDRLYPDVKTCPNTKTATGSLNGVNGIFWTVCFTYTSAAQSFPAAASLFAGANADGSVHYDALLLTAVDNLTSFANETRPLLAGIQWKLK